MNLICAIDHSSRAGNYFFQTLFDLHSEVLVCPWVQYTYSYLVTAFDLRSELPADEARAVMCERGYFRLVYQEATGKIADTIRAFGSDPQVAIDRPKVRTVFDALTLGPTVSRRRLVAASFYAYARGIGRDVTQVKYLLVSDAISLRSEDVLGEHSGRVLSAVRADFPEARIVSLERDPRATFASCRHQYVNSLGNAYAVRANTVFRQLWDLLCGRFTDGGNVNAFFLLYHATAARAMYRWKARLGESLLTVRNEDLNCDFVPTMRSICEWLGIGIAPEWLMANYTPTNVGEPWHGKGAYSNRYNRVSTAMLENDSDAASASSAGPNAYVTMRWADRLWRNEKIVIEHLLREEFIDLGYPFVGSRTAASSSLELLWAFMAPFQGEIPNARWLRRIINAGPRAILDAAAFLVTSPLFYLLTRIQLARAIAVGRFRLGSPVQVTRPGRFAYREMLLSRKLDRSVGTID